MRATVRCPMAVLAGSSTAVPIETAPQDVMNPVYCTDAVVATTNTDGW
jgi:hypothetical protein